MNHKLLSVRAVLLSLCLLASITSAQTPGPTPSADDAVARLSAELEPKIKEEIQQGHLPGFAIGVVKDGKLIYAKGFGVAKLGGNRPVTSRSLFHMASVTKTFVATAVMQLMEKGKIDLQSPLTRYFPHLFQNYERYPADSNRQMLRSKLSIPESVNYNWYKP